MVGTKKANWYGLYDMSGNVREWCWDRYTKDMPNDVQDPVGVGTANPVWRGGAWRDDTSSCVCTYRRYQSPNAHNYDLGLRLVCRP